MSTVRGSAPTEAEPAAATGDRNPADVPSESSRRRLTPDALRTVVAYVLAGLGSALGGLWSQRILSADLRVPFVYWGDAVAVAAHVKTVLETGWYEHQPLLGAPAGQTYHDFPTADNLHLAVIRVLGLVLGDWAVTLNVYFLLGFPLAGLAAMVFLRGVGVGRISAVAASVLFAMAPYHLVRGENHLWLASYYPVPLGLLLVVRAVRGEPLWTLRRGSARAVLTSPAVLTVVTAVLLASASAYYAVFTLGLLGVVAVAGFVHRRDWRRLVGVVAAAGAVFAVMLANMLPDMLWARTHGSSEAAFVREPQDAEYFALKITSLLLPTPQHPVPFLSRVREWYDGRYPLGSEQPALGLVGAVGLVVLLVVAVLWLLRPAVSRVEASTRWRTLVELGALTVVALLFSTVGGVSTLVSFVTPEIRGWNRMSILIGLLCLAAVGLLLDAGREVLARRTGARVAQVVAAALALVLTVGGVYDQVSPQRRPDHVGSAAGFARDAQLVTALERELGEGAMIAQLPYVPFPESAPVNGVFDTDQLRMYLHSATLRWSAGGIKGRAASDWVGVLDPADARTTAAALAAAGFDAAMLDLAALGDDADEVSESWRAELGAPTVASEDGRHEVYALADRRAELVAEHGEETVGGVGETVVEPTLASPGEGVAGVERADDGTWRLEGSGAPVEVLLDNARPATTRVLVTFHLGSVSEGTVTWPDGSTTTEARGQVEREVEVPAGRSVLTVAPPAEGAVVVLDDLAVTVADRPALAELLG